MANPAQRRFVNGTKKVALGLIAVIVGFSLLGTACGSTEESSASKQEASSKEEASSKPDPAPVRLIASKSFCLANPYDAKVYFYMTVRNPNSEEQDVDARPWRRYSDNSTNDSFMDTLTMTVPAGTTKKFKAEFGYNAENHSLLECGLYFDGEATLTKIAAV
jgi:hypothetical protein